MTATITARLAAATGADYRLDAQVLLALGWTTRPGRGPQPLPDWFDPDGKCVGNPPHVTASIDAAVALIERVLPKCGVFLNIPSDEDSRALVRAGIEQSEREWTYYGWPQAEAPTAPLALLGALFMALEAKAAP